MNTYRRWIEPVGFSLFIVSGWEVLSRTAILPQPEVPPPSAVISSIVPALFEMRVLEATWVTVWTAALGLAIAAVIAIPLGFLAGRFGPVYRSVILTVEVLRPIPTVALIPLLVLLYGIGNGAALALVLLSVIWPLLIQAIYGAREVDPVALETAVVYGYGRVKRFWSVVVPSAMPYIVGGLRFSAVLSLIMAIAASLIIGGKGLGSLIARASDSAAFPRMYALIAVCGIIGLLWTLALMRVERRWLHWHSSYRGSR